MNPKFLARQIVYQLEMIAQRARFAKLPAPEGGWPALLGISFPKSGTHLLDQILLGFSRAAPYSRRVVSFFAGYDGATGRKRSLDETLAWVDGLRPGDVASAHLFAWPEVLERVCTPKFMPFFIYRDPRDVVVSHVFYITEMEPGHVHHKYYNEVLAGFDERLLTSILGLPDSPVEFPDIAARFAPYLGWIDRPEVLCLQYEQFVHDRAGMLQRICDRFLQRNETVRTPPGLILESLELSINPKKSPTFRSGKTGEWRKYFTEEHKRAFKNVAGDLLVKLRYEKDNDW
jgi:sulfotransferase 6B1